MCVGEMLSTFSASRVYFKTIATGDKRQIIHTSNMFTYACLSVCAFEI